MLQGRLSLLRGSVRRVAREPLGGGGGAGEAERHEGLAPSGRTPHSLHPLAPSSPRWKLPPPQGQGSSGAPERPTCLWAPASPSCFGARVEVLLCFCSIGVLLLRSACR